LLSLGASEFAPRLQLSANVHYQVSTGERTRRYKRGALVDRGANGGIIGSDARIHLEHQREVDVTGIDNHELSGLKLVNATATTMTQRGPVIIHMRQYAYHGRGRTIHASGQIEYYKNKVDDRALIVEGKQCIRTNDGFVIPLDMINGLPYLPMAPNTDDEWETLPHVLLTSGDPWDPKVLDLKLSDQPDWYNTIKELEDGIVMTPFDEYGNYRQRHNPTAVTILEPVDPTNTPAAPPDDPDDIEGNFHELEGTDSETFRACYTELCNLNERYLVFDTEIEHKKAREVKAKPIDYERYRPYFLHMSVDKIRKTFKNTTQLATNIMAGRHIQQTIKSPFPAHNVWRRNEPVATDTVYAECAAIDTNGQTMAQIFIGRKSLVIDIYGMKTSKEFVNTLEDEIRKRGAMDKLISDSAQVEISKRVLDIVRALCIDTWQSEANMQHQNFAEHRWKFFKKNIEWYMNWRNIPGYAWLLCAEWVADVMNMTSEESLGDRPPLTVLTGQTIDISIMLCFLFWDIVYVARYKDRTYGSQIGSAKSSEIRGRFVGFAWSVGHGLTFKVLTDDSKKVISRSVLRLAKVGENNLKLDTEAGAVPQRVYIRSKRDKEGDDVILPTIDVSKNPIGIGDAAPEGSDAPEKGETDPPEEGESAHEEGELNANTPMDDPPLKDRPLVEEVDEDDDGKRAFGEPLDLNNKSMKTDRAVDPGLPPEEVIDRTFLLPPEEDGSRHRARIIGRIQATKDELAKDPELIKFKCRVNDEYDEIVAYNDFVDYIEAKNPDEFFIKDILDHKKVTKRSPEYKGSMWNLKVLWEGNEVTWEPLTTADRTGMFDFDRVTVANYAAKNKLLDTKGWKLPGMKTQAKVQRRMIRTANKAKLHSFRHKPIYMYGFQVPRNHEQAMEMDRENGNTKWFDAEQAELSQIDEYDTFTDKGEGYTPSQDYKKIRVHFVYAVKHDGRHKARLVAGGHLTETPIDSVYSSVVSLRGIRILTFLSELNGCELWATDIGNAYLESYTQEKVYIVAGPEFGEREGRTLIITRALYGLRSSGLRWHERFADVLRDMGFFPSRAERDIWMRDKGTHYEYIAVYVDDLMIASKLAKAIIASLRGKYQFKLKGTGPITFHLGMDYFRDEDGTLCAAPLKYIQKMMDNYVRIFGQQPKKASSPLVKGDHPELDGSELLDMDGIKIYQSLIGATQWLIQLGRFDVMTAVMTMSRFRAAPRKGHMERVQRIHGYVSKMRHGVIRIRTDEPDFSDIPVKDHDWKYTCYQGAEELIPKDAPPPRGKRVVLSAYFDANLYHDMISGRSVTGILQLANKTVIDFFSKLQSTVETATFGSEYVAGRTCMEQNIDIRTTFRYLGVPIETPTVVFGDNESMVNTASVPQGKLQKRHNALSFHRVRECIAAGIARLHHIAGTTNPADILSKHWDYAGIWAVLRPLLFWRGDTAEIAKDVLKKDGPRGES